MLPIDRALTAIGEPICNQEITQLTLDSRAIAPGAAFIAIKGHQLDGSQFIGQALEKGASLVLVDEDCKHRPNLANVQVVNNLAEKLSTFASTFYNFPSSQFSLIGITGTNGKSTVASMIANLGVEKDIKTGVIGTLGYGQTEHLTPLANTTPSCVELQRLFSEMADYQLVAMEVSSHGLEQKRVANTEFDVTVFTNLSRDHLDYHGTMQAYADEKLKLFTEFNVKSSVINADDPVAQEWLERGLITSPTLYGENIKSDVANPFISFENLVFTQSGIKCRLKSTWGDAEISLPLFGKFNLYNLAAALGVLLNLSYDFDYLIDKISHLDAVVGRMQAFSAEKQPTCIIDYAHTPDALEQALIALSQHVGTNITCVFGCGGDRDKGKRALMANIAERYSERVIVTNDNPRTESQQEIVEDILKGFGSAEAVHIEYDRAKAIALAIELTPADGIVLIAGKGHEDYQIIGNETLYFSDQKVAQEILRGKNQ